MKSTSYQQFAIVAADSAQLLSDRLNSKLYELRDKHPVVTFEGLIARISYEECDTVPECLADEYRAKGVSLNCGDCPFFEPVSKKDGTKDERVKWGDCPNAHYGRTSCEAPACDLLFEMINGGEIKLSLPADERGTE